MDSWCNNIRTDMYDVINSKLNVDSSNYITNSTISSITNSQKVMTELLDGICGTIMLAANADE